MSAILSVGLAAVALVALGTSISAERKQVQQRKLQNNLRLAKAAVVERTATETSLPLGAGAPKAVVSQTSHDFGVVIPYESVSYSFHVKNDGEGPLALRLGDGTCDCTVGSLDRAYLAPGEATRVALTFTAKASESIIEHSVTLLTNDSAHPRFVLTLKGEVRKHVWLSRRELSFVDLQPAQERTEVFHVFVDWEEPPVLENVRGGDGQLRISIDAASPEAIAEAGASHGVRVEATCTSAMAGESAGVLYFDVVRSRGGDERHAQTVSYWAKRNGRIEIMHRDLYRSGELELGHLRLGEGKEITLLVKVRGDDKLVQLDRYEATPPFMKLALRPHKTAERTGLHHLTLTIPQDAPEGSFAGPSQGKITLYFSDPALPPVTLRPRFFITRN